MTRNPKCCINSSLWILTNRLQRQTQVFKLMFSLAVASVGIGVCVSHKVGDAASLCCFLHAWAATTTGINPITLAPCLDSAPLFPPSGVHVIKPEDMISDEKVVTTRFLFNRQSLAKLKSKIAIGNVSPTSVEAATALIWKTFMEAVRVNSVKDVFVPSVITHAVNIRRKMEPPLPENSFGNHFQNAVAEYHKDMELNTVAELLRKAIRKIDRDHLSELRVEGLAKAIKPFKQLKQVALEGGKVLKFSSWTRFPFYEIDFGWRNPIRACTVNMPFRNLVVLMATRSGDGMEALVNLTEIDMVKFECNEELLQFVSDFNSP